MGKIELGIKAKLYDDALKDLDNYEKKYGADSKLQLYKGQMLQKAGKNRDAIDYLDKSLESEDTIVAFNAKGDALYELKEYKKALDYYNRCIPYENKVEDDLDLVTNFNYKSAFCCVNLGNNQEAVKYLNKTIEMLNEHGRLPNDLEMIYQKCSFEKERIMKTCEVKDEQFKQSRFLSTKTAISALIVIIILYIILRLLGYN
jgi:tetratricopeptide (TPR) repeat protein